MAKHTFYQPEGARGCGPEQVPLPQDVAEALANGQRPPPSLFAQECAARAAAEAEQKSDNVIAFSKNK